VVDTKTLELGSSKEGNFICEERGGLTLYDVDGLMGER
jgi:hypothetical protein